MIRFLNRFGFVAFIVSIAIYAAPTNAVDLLTNNENFNDAPYDFGSSETLPGQAPEYLPEGDPKVA